eukprot:snap_masked-scaffold103_size370364-processed-gene-1.3 protein:Tk07516 transcript:snap_masked-scaffold103_size370364-processed-gene-1.3-mRNA-1 annotation:"g-protein coupled receptor family c group 5 member c isoform x2"
MKPSRTFLWLLALGTVILGGSAQLNTTESQLATDLTDVAIDSNATAATPSLAIQVAAAISEANATSREETHPQEDLDIGESRAEARQLRFPNFPEVNEFGEPRPMGRPPYLPRDFREDFEGNLRREDSFEDEWPSGLPRRAQRLPPPRKSLRRFDRVSEFKNTIVSRRPPRPPSGIYRAPEESFELDINLESPTGRRRRPGTRLEEDIVPIRSRPNKHPELNTPRYARPSTSYRPIQGNRQRNPDLEVDDEEEEDRFERGSNGPSGEASNVDGLMFNVPPPYDSLTEWESKKTVYAGEESPFSFPYPTTSAEPPRAPPPIPKSTRPSSPDARYGGDRNGKFRRGYYPSIPERPKGSYSPRPLIPYRPTPARPATDEDSGYRRSSSALDSTQQNVKRVNLQTEYFSLPSVVTRSTIPFRSTTLPTVRPSRIPVLVKKLAKRPVKKSTPLPDRTPLTIATSKPFQKTNQSDLCSDSDIECDEAIATNGTIRALTDILRGEIWVIPIVVASLVLVGILLIFEVYLVFKSIRANPSRRHLFLGQMLMLGLFSCCAMAICLGIKPTEASCAAMRIGIGVAYTIIYSTLLVKLVFLISLNSGVYLPATYQCLLLCFAILIQVVVGVQWLVSSPAEVLTLAIKPEGDLYQTCSVTFEQQITGLLYVIFLVLVVVVLAFKSRGVRENYREAMYIGLTMGFTVCIFTLWILAGFITPTHYKDICMASGLIASAAITFIIMFMPKGRQLSAMGQEGVYAEDRADVYTGSSTQSTGSGGTPSPSFFPIKAGKLVGQQLRENRERLDTPPAQRKNG